ncbi:MAG: hypothetical protein U9R79_08095 [Armatimonadota bacterium]|nr:hypothetical protein [Armatimonadota bacterium]
MAVEAYHTFSLTVAEGKRLIGKGVAAMPCVRRAMEGGIVVVTRSTTSGYVLEELLGEEIDRCRFVTGRTLPSAHPERGDMLSANLPEMVFRNGRLDESADPDTIVDELKAGDVVIKSANALDYERGVVGVLIGAPSGGTVGKYLGLCHGRHVHFVAPCGLEKQVVGNLLEASARLSEGGELLEGPSLWVIPAQMCTELEAIRLLTGAEAMQIAAGGVMGAEGATWITAMGSAEQIERVQAVVEDVRGEPEMLDYAQQ